MAAAATMAVAAATITASGSSAFYAYEFASYNDNLEEVFENREQIEISRYYEKLPKPTLIATQEYVEGKIYYRNPAKEKEKLQ